ncbi:hypothetical protein KJ972_04875, partial [Candidatus Micrarchaeota archaeon]|nr:hypothetical protein [Candidatus Micrarchaeota archaeon]
MARLKEIVKRPKKETTTETIIQTSQSRTDSRPSFYSQPREKTPIEKTNESTPPIGVSPFPKPQAPKPKLALTLKKNHEFESAESAQKKPAEERISQPIFVQKKEPIPSGVFPTPEPPKETPVKEELEPLQETEPAEMKVQTETSTSKKPSARKYNKKVKPTRVSKAKKATRKKAKPKRISKAKKPSARKYR